MKFCKFDCKSKKSELYSRYCLSDHKPVKALLLIQTRAPLQIPPDVMSLVLQLQNETKEARDALEVARSREVGREKNGDGEGSCQTNHSSERKNSGQSHQNRSQIVNPSSSQHPPNIENYNDGHDTQSSLINWSPPPTMSISPRLSPRSNGNNIRIGGYSNFTAGSINSQLTAFSANSVRL